MALTLPTFSLPSVSTVMDRLPSISGTFIGRDVQPYETWAPCAASIMAGAVSSVATGSLGPLLAGVQLCGVSGVAAQIPLTGDIRVNTYTTDRQASPSSAFLENGNSVVTWRSDLQDGDQSGIYAQIIGPRGTFVGGEFQVNTFTTSIQSSSNCAYIGNNRFVIAWHSLGQDGDSFGIFYRIFNTNGTPLSIEMRANVHTMGSQQTPSIASVGNGSFVITWESDNQIGTGKEVYCRNFDSSGNPLSSEILVNTMTTSFQEDAAIASGPNGTFAITWTGANSGDPDGIAAQFFNRNAVKIGSERPINTHTNDFQQWPAITFLGSERLAIAWQSDNQDSDNYGIYLQMMYDNGTFIGPERLVNTHTVQAQRYPSLADLANNLFVTVWESDAQDGDGNGIFGQFFDYDGNRVGLEFLVNAVVNGSQTVPRAVSIGNSTFFVVWESNTLSSDIYVRFFNTTQLPPLTTGSTGSTGTTATTKALQTTGTTAFVNPTSTTATPTASAGSSSTKTDLTWLWVVLGVTGGVIVCGGGAFLALRKRQSGSRGTTTSTSSSSGGHYGVAAAVPPYPVPGRSSSPTNSAHHQNERKRQRLTT